MQNELNGIFVIDKPVNVTSAQVVARVKKLLGVRKAGHTGTLDPFATGVMLCCVNQATKLARFFLHGDKTYEAVLHLGIETDTQDLTGTIISRHDEINISEETITSVFRQFEGKTEQVPPVYSALKHKGVPLYKLARKGKPVQKPARQVFISSINILDISLPEIRFDVSCSGGTYIRTLASDIGASLGCGGHLKELRRTKSTGFTINEAVSLSELAQLISPEGEFSRVSDRMVPMSDALRDMPAYVADNVLTKKIMYGNVITKKDVMLAETDNTQNFVKIVDTDNNLLAILSDNKGSHRYKYCCVFHSSQTDK
ncbi:tRNA pseudouridine(55) synthase TruB [Desulfonema magnum]|uniref:tRNA pseudouridine synthase B n=1 Tax=Desulfonema magnum TaxID=45655 RepID=A0A975BXM7_9BACT|nr:tRNA pseudouridine(55) synthase TruB [Desulfonema magnum]QTA93392.1 tRNA pseudouridine synthase B [Desulfonema magnum]